MTTAQYTGLLERFPGGDIVGTPEPDPSGWNVAVFPNPAMSGQASLVITSPHRGELTAEIFGIAGESTGSVQTISVSGKNSQSVPLNCGSLPPGLYLIRITSPGFCASLKFVVN